MLLPCDRGCSEGKCFGVDTCVDVPVGQYVMTRTAYVAPNPKPCLAQKRKLCQWRRPPAPLSSHPLQPQPCHHHHLLLHWRSHSQNQHLRKLNQQQPLTALMICLLPPETSLCLNTRAPWTHHFQEILEKTEASCIFHQGMDLQDQFW